jgi:hypothetical protein
VNVSTNKKGNHTMVVDPLIKFMKISEVARSANEAAPGAKRRRFFPHSINLLYLDSGTSSLLSSQLTL